MSNILSKKKKSALSHLVTISRKFSFKMERMLLGTITHVSTANNIAALTFDDGPDPEFTPRLLEILENYGARATFFMLGVKATQHPNILKQVANAGHAIGNHSWDHAIFTSLSMRECYRQVLKCQQALAPFGVRIFRPPKGYQNRLSRITLFSLGFKVVTWNVGVEDYFVKPPESMAADLIRQVEPGCIICLHDGLWDPRTKEAMDRSQTLRAVELMLERVGDRFQFVTIPYLLKCGSPQKMDWYMSGK